jgi:predicted transcriptional regulator
VLRDPARQRADKPGACSVKTAARVHPIIVALDHRTRHLGIKQCDLARALGVNSSSVRSWRTARRAPAYVHVARWAEHVGLTLAAISVDRRIVASGPSLPARFRDLRVESGRSQAEVGARRHVRGECVSSMEIGRRAHPGLVTVDDHLAALDLRLTLLRPVEEAMAA